jgi:hypothetical protein
VSAAVVLHQPSQALVFRPNEEAVQRLMPVFTPALALQRYQVVNDLIKEILVPGVDFGKVPGSDRDTLLKPGAEKICTFFGFVPKYEYELVTEEWGSEDSEPLFAYRIKCQLWRGDYMAGEGMGFCSSRESKYRYRWIDEATADLLSVDKAKAHKKKGSAFEFDFAVSKAETSGKYGKPAEYWAKWQAAIKSGKATKVQKETKNGMREGWQVDAVQYRVPNPDIADQINTVLKMSMKRAYVAATVVSANVSDRFTQDVEDFVDVDYEHVAEKPIDTGGHAVGTQAAANHVRDLKLAEIRKEQANPTNEGSQPVTTGGSGQRQAASQSGAGPQDTTQPTEKGGVQRPVATAVIDVADVSAKRNDVKSTTPPPAGKQESRSVDQQLHGFWAHMTKMEGRVSALRHFSKLYDDFYGAEGQERFNAILAKHGIAEVTRCESLNAARMAVKEMYIDIWPRVEAQQASQAAATT